MKPNGMDVTYIHTYEYIVNVLGEDESYILVQNSVWIKLFSLSSYENSLTVISGSTT